jgi:hypothetical protein
MEYSCDPLAVENISGKHCDYRTYLAKRAKARSGACAEVQFPDFGTVMWSPGSINNSMKAAKHYDISKYLTMRARDQSGECAEVHFPYYGTVLWSPDSRNSSRKALRVQHQSCQES